MAEAAWREASTRRQSFRRNLEAAGLPPEDLERLEQKRKQLDESIHKYIAAKEREYKSFEKELIQRHKLGLDQDGQKARRTSAESPPEAAVIGSPRSQGKQHNENAVGAPLSAEIRKEQSGQPVPVGAMDDHVGSPTSDNRTSTANLVDRRASMERDKELIGLFTPAYLPALGNSRRGMSPQRVGSAPPAAATSAPSQPAVESGNGVERADSDSAVQAKAKRPILLQSEHRTSSSGSSENGSGRLPSALKSPTHRPKKKRVSLAINDTIVAPSDTVPESMSSNNSTPSHSRTRAPAAEREATKTAPLPTLPNDSPQQAESVTAPYSALARATMTNELNKEEIARGKLRTMEERKGTPVPSPTKSSARSAGQAPAAIDGDLEFALDDDDVVTSPRGRRPLSPLDSGDEAITGRVSSSNPNDDPSDSHEGLPPDAGDDSDDHAEHLEFKPCSVQQTNSPGFRRPLATMDPVYMGADYARAERSAVSNDTYGSSYIRPSSKGSFTAGSLGESFMAQNAERLMRSRMSGVVGESTSVRS